MLSYLIAGLAVGAVYAISAMALVITYNASRVFNFAQAEFGLLCPVSMTDSLARTLRRYGDPGLV